MSASRHCLLALAVALSLSCGAEETIGPLEVKVLLPIGGRGDGSLADSIFAGVRTARAGATFDVEYYVPSGPDDAAATFRSWAEDGGRRQLLVLGTGPYAAFVEERGCDFGGASVLALDASVATCSDLRSVHFASYAPAFLGGVAAVSDPALAPNARAGIIVGAEIPATRELVDGFTEGVEFAGGTVASVVFVSDDPAIGFDDASTAAELTRQMLDDVDVIYAVAGRAGLGIADALDENRLGGGGPVYLIASDTDQSARYGRLVIGSVLKRADAVTRDAILEMIAGDLASGATTVGFRDGLTEFALHPRRGAAILSGDCSGCDLFDPRCYSACTTLEDVVDDARPAALEAAAVYEDAR